MAHQEEIDRAGVDSGSFVRFQKDWYDGSIRGMDVELGRVLERLDQLDLTEKTVIAFLSDHGEEFLEHGRQWHGNTVYGEMTNVPMLLYWPGHLPQGRIVEETVQSIDLMPTLLALSALDAPEEAQGESLLGLIQDREGAEERFRRRPVFSERAIPPSEVEAADAGTQVASLAIVMDGWKLIKNTQRPDDFPAVELYNHREDPLNLTNVAPRRPEVVEKLLSRLEQWHESAQAARVDSDTDAEELSPEELKRLRSLGYIR
jgi:arylsulfatase A-like enzyme